MNKICNYENCPYLCSVVWFEGSFTLLWLPFSKRKIGCLNAPSTVQTHGNIKHESGFSPYNEVEGIVRGLFLFYDRLITFQKNPKRRLWFY